MKKLTLLTLTLVLTALAQLTAPPVQAEVSIPDAELAAVIRETLGLPAGAAITADAMRKLTELSASDRGIANLTGLQHATELKRLVLDGTAVSDISPLAGLTNLTGLYLYQTAVSDISPLAGLTNLERLTLSRTAVSDISPLASLTNLRVLNLTYTAVSDVSPLASLTNLMTLYLGNTAVSDVSPLASLTNLWRLYLHGTAVSDISPLAGLTNLRVLTLGGTAVSDISPLAGLTNLWRLTLGGTAVSDISPLASLTNLTELSLSGTAVSDVSPLASLTNLETLSLSRTAVSDVSPLASLTNLETLDLYDTDVWDVSALASLTNLEWLYLGGCPLSYASIYTHIPALQAKGIEVDFDNVADVNGDGVVNTQDLVLVSDQFGKTGEHRADVNCDGVVNIQDLVWVAGAFGEGAAAPSVRAVSRARLTVSDVERWLIEARASMRSGSGEASRPGGLSYRRGIAVLERLLASLMPKTTALLANYPNPFNPETWIPYQLSEPAEVTVTIYAANGAVVRRLDLGHRRAGSYESRSRAAYWDGRNAAGESVASGVYFYTLSAGDFSATRKMVIRK